MNQEIINRRSIRKYLNQPVEDDKIIEMIESARLAPSGSNTQPWQFIVVRDTEMRHKIAEVSHQQKWMTEAPVHIICVGDMLVRLTDPADINVNEESPDPELKQVIRDTSIAVEHMVLTAENIGLKTCWVAWFTQEDIRPVLGIPSNKYALAVLTVGYSDEQPPQRPRKTMEDIVRYEKW